LSFTSVWSRFGLNVADLRSERRMFVAARIW
jgi:hypothetical protein